MGSAFRPPQSNHNCLPTRIAGILSYGGDLTRFSRLFCCWSYKEAMCANGNRHQIKKDSCETHFPRCVRRVTRRESPNPALVQVPSAQHEGHLYVFRLFTSIFVSSAMFRVFVDRRQCRCRLWSDFSRNPDWNRSGSNRRHFAECDHLRHEHQLEHQVLRKNQ